MNKTFWAIIAVIIVIFGGILIFNGSKHSGSNATNNAQPTSNVTGKGTSGVTLVEYGDFQCPVCGQYYPLVEEVVQKYNDQIFFQFRNLPLIQIHQNAFAAARAGQAAAKQGKFWDMYNKLYSNQSAWASSSNPVPIFDQYAQQIGLNMDQYKKDYASSATNDIINADIAAFDKTGQEKATPTFFLDGKKIKATTLDEFSQFIDTEIQAKQNK